MSKLSEDARAAAKSKAERLVRADPHAKVDASGYSPDGALNGDVQTGPRVLSRRAFRAGGKVSGESAPSRADRKPRATGGRALTADSLINRDVKAANQERAGIKFVGGMKRGGRAHKTMGGLALPAWSDAVSRATGGRTARATGGALPSKLPYEHKMEQPKVLRSGKPLSAKDVYKVTKSAARREANPDTGTAYGGWDRDDRKSGGSVHGASCVCAKCGGGRVAKKDGGAINDGTRPDGGRIPRKAGGRAKTNVNIIITQPSAKPPMAPMGMPPPGPVGMRQGAPPQPPQMPPQAMPPSAPTLGMMPRATGGRANDGFGQPLAKPGKYPIESGSGGGLGRLEKAERASRG